MLLFDLEAKLNPKRDTGHFFLSFLSQIYSWFDSNLGITSLRLAYNKFYLLEKKKMYCIVNSSKRETSIALAVRI